MTTFTVDCSTTLTHETREFPNGDIQFSITKDLTLMDQENHHVGWALHPYYTDKQSTSNIYHKTCLGVYQCPKCNFIEWPCQHTVTKKGKTPQEPLWHCHTHKLLGKLQKCDASMTIHHPHQYTEDPVIITFVHSGLHQHLRSPPKSADSIGHWMLDSIISIAPELHPKNLQIGTSTCKPATEFHPAYANLDHIRVQRHCTLSKNTPGNTLGDLSAYEAEINNDYILSSSMAWWDHHFSIQTSFFQNEYIQTLKESMQSNSVHGWIVDSKHNDVNLTITSTFCPVIERTVPVLISVMYGKSAVHYEQHFLTLLWSLSYATWDDFQENFPGMTCDFSNALCIGFEQALQTFYSITEADLALECFYWFCQVHYKQSLTQVHWNHGVIPAAEENNFYNLSLHLLEMKIKPEFDKVIETIHTQYPNTKKWIEWYLYPSQAKHIFPAMTVHDNSAMAKDTNAQESIGGDIKCSSGKSKISAVEAGHHAVAYMCRIEEDYQLAITGTQLQYKKNKKIVNKKVSWKAGDIYTNDGRALDATKTLLPALKWKTRMGHPKGSHNKVPKVDIITKTFGIPWQFKYNGFIGKNTCSLDTTLTAWYLLHKYQAAQLPTAVQNIPAGIVLSNVLDKIDQGDYDHAQWLWYTQVLNCKATGTHDLFLSLKRLSSTVCQGWRVLRSISLHIAATRIVLIQCTALGIALFASHCIIHM